MAKYTKKNTTVSDETKDEALKVAKATQRPGQSKEQTKLIAQGIQKGIDHYKKQQKSKARELDKKLKKVSTVQTQPEDQDPQQPEATTKCKCCKLPWFLLVVSWIGFAAYIFLK